MIATLILIPLLAAMPASNTPCHPLEGDRITAGDLAKILPAFAQIASEAVMGYAPQPGAFRNLVPAELTRFAAANGVEFHGIETVCFEPALRELEPSGVQAAIRESLTAIGVGVADIEIIELSKFRVPSGRLSFPVESMPAYAIANIAIWNGFVEHESRRYPVWARVRITAPQTRVVATANLPAGERLDKSAVRVEEVRTFPTRVALLTSVADCEGKIARHYLAVGATVTSADLMPAFDVDRGEIVKVEVQSGGTLLLLEAEAQSSGRRDQTIALRNSTSGKIFRARITGKGRALLDCGSPGI